MMKSVTLRRRTHGTSVRRRLLGEGRERAGFCAPATCIRAVLGPTWIIPPNEAASGSVSITCLAHARDSSQPFGGAGGAAAA